MERALGVAALILLLGGCSQSAQSTSSPSPQATNPIGFPLYTPSTILRARPHEVIAESPASMDQLDMWLQGLTANPPPGYAVAASGSSMDAAHTRAKAMGVEFQIFTHAIDGKTHALVVVALDPSTFEAKAGPILGLIDKYPMLPPILRDPIDQQAKERTGFTVSQALDPAQPIGAALAAVRAMRNSGERGVVLVDAARN
ncbi:MAG TPA: hypothetical protein VMF11_06295 [Candidatus Baltobacteraceae bacterium]|nr:hypothetical protein [Candidatus Baltobacteraceae bacterium]